MGTRLSARIEEGSGGRQRRVEALYVLAAFASGASMMIVEITGNRLLAPVFGSSTFSWTALIGVVLVAATAGGYLGGALADRPEAGRSMERMLYLTAFDYDATTGDDPAGELESTFGPVIDRMRDVRPTPWA